MRGGKLPFFDPSKARGPRSSPDVGEDVTADFVGDSDPTAMSVSLLLAQIKAALGQAFPQKVCVAGEISNFKLHSSGHMYFRLKDTNAAVDAAMFRSHASRLKFLPTDGLEVVIEGRVDVYEVRGQLQLYVEKMTPRGAGALELALKQLREKLQREGLFEPQHKKPIPRIPRAIGVVTSPTGAAISDIRRTLARRWPAARVYLLPTAVQGEGSAESIARAIRLLDANAARYEIDTIIVGRGGGSLEDLWAFNEEPVVRAIFAAQTPIISGVGHEVDVTIADLVADVRAATPTAAAELAAPDAAQMARHVAQLAGRLRSRTQEQLRWGQTAMEGILRSIAFRDPTWRVRTLMQQADELGHRLGAAMREELTRGRSRLEPAANRLAALHPARLRDRAQAQLDKLISRLAWALGRQTKSASDKLAVVAAGLQAAHPRHRLRLAKQRTGAIARQLAAMSYRSVLKRGYSVTRRSDGSILRSVRAAKIAELIETELADGRLTSTVTEAKGKRTGGGKDLAGKASRQDRTLFD